MLVTRAFKTELAPNNKQRSLFRQYAGTRRFVFNWGLATWQYWYKDGKRPSGYGLCKHFNSIKRDQCPWIVAMPYAIGEAAFRDLQSAFQHFFRRVKQSETPGYPKFKKRHGPQSFALRSTRVEPDRVRLTGVGWVRLKERNYLPISSRPVKFGTYATVSCRAGRWYISVLAQWKEADPRPNNTLVVGVDLGLKNLVVLSNGETFENPHALVRLERKLKRLQRELSRRERRSANWRKTKAKIAKCHAAIANSRKHVLHNISHHITTDLRPSTIVIEDLNVSGMMKNHHLAKAIADVGFYELRRQIEYKAKRLGIEVLVADRWYASSKTCSGCGWHNVDLVLSDRVFRCPECGLELDRDLNAAKNLKQLAA